MNELLGYIFNTLKSSEVSIKNLNRAVNSQRSFNGKVTAFAFLTVTYAVLNNGRLRLQDEKIKKLTEEIEELKKTKGE